LTLQLDERRSLDGRPLSDTAALDFSAGPTVPPNSTRRVNFCEPARALELSRNRLDLFIHLPDSVNRRMSETRALGLGRYFRNGGTDVLWPPWPKEIVSPSRSSLCKFLFFFVTKAERVHVTDEDGDPHSRVEGVFARAAWGVCSMFSTPRPAGARM
jgi:hypothetical protein